MLRETSLVIVSLHSPKEQVWGVVESLSTMGVILRAININSFEDWARQVARGEEITIGLVSTFFPMHRIEKIFADEDIGAVKSYATQFQELVGMSIEAYLESQRPESGFTH
ncbi:MAG TPA: hypothetical protein PK014_13010 [Thermoanaerobaculia bacterium]|nr:hypothetical protein [Thermoanaerobaculia bacterium]HUM31019.1 hypothetical protein [Thermoanaerobaculia bacterium]HXK69317.1 hypothetical protein [Thermoanaerobaculia bacterium]